mmetsp:Transcript_19311/g.41733  ORF Transcript_19311/g.41733 Transcript_19311/m.41733 type:complete len:212 (-) Transcript_19311:273-908(-)
MSPHFWRTLWLSCGRGGSSRRRAAPPLRRLSSGRLRSCAGRITATPSCMRRVRPCPAQTPAAGPTPSPPAPPACTSICWHSQQRRACTRATHLLDGSSRSCCQRGAARTCCCCPPTSTPASRTSCSPTPSCCTCSCCVQGSSQRPPPPCSRQRRVQRPTSPATSACCAWPSCQLMHRAPPRQQPPWIHSFSCCRCRSSWALEQEAAAACWM